MDKYSNIPELTKKYHLVEFKFDTECIYDKGDLSYLLRHIIEATLPELGIKIIEEISIDGARYVATLSNGELSIQIFADTNSDWLPDDFFQQLASIPILFGSNKLYCSLNPLISTGLVGQDAWYFCGTEKNLKAAREDGIPIIFPGEDITETQEFKDL
jgi:hypothetical protein